MMKTRTVTDRRTLHFNSIADIAADVDAFGLDEDAIRASGNWTPAQIVTHVTYFMDSALDGFAISAPWPLRAIGRLLRGGVQRRPMKPGLALPRSLQSALPAPDATWSGAVDGLHAAAARIERGEQMTHPSPVFGALTHEQWVGLHCRHAEMHFSFLHPARTAPSTVDPGGN